MGNYKRDLSIVKSISKNKIKFRNSNNGKIKFLFAFNRSEKDKNQSGMCFKTS